MSTSPLLLEPGPTHSTMMLPKFYQVSRWRRELDDTFTLEFATPEPFYFSPGQFNMLYQFGSGEVPISISGDPDRSDSLVHTVRAVGAVTRSMAKLRRGASIGVRGPFGTGWPIAQARGYDVVIVAGGLGLAPLRPAIYSLLAKRADYGRIYIFYGARTPADILFIKDLQRWRGRFDLTVEVTVDRADSGWSGRVGVVTKRLNRSFDPLYTVAMVCGPEVMMRYAARALNEQGIENEQIYLSLERNMKCAIGVCGHCQFGPSFVCKDGPVYRLGDIQHLLTIRGL